MDACLFKQNQSKRNNYVYFSLCWLKPAEEERFGLQSELMHLWTLSGISVWSENCLLATFRWKRRCLLNCFHRFLRTREIFNERTFDGRSFSDVTVCFFSSFSLWSFNCFQPGQLWVHSLKRWFESLHLTSVNVFPSFVWFDVVFCVSDIFLSLQQQVGLSCKSASDASCKIIIYNIYFMVI